MKVMVGLFTTESNANVPGKNEIGSYDLGFGDDCVRKLRVGEVFQAAGIDVIPSVYASAGASGVITRETFDYIESLFVRTVKEHLHEIDGIYLHLHGASTVEGLGSGDHHILKKIRELTGPYLPIYGFGLCTLFLLASLEDLHLIADPVWNRVALFLAMAVAMTLIEYISAA